MTGKRVKKEEEEEETEGWADSCYGGQKMGERCASGEQGTGSSGLGAASYGLSASPASSCWSWRKGRE